MRPTEGQAPASFEPAPGEVSQIEVSSYLERLFVHPTYLRLPWAIVGLPVLVLPAHRFHLLSPLLEVLQVDAGARLSSVPRTNHGPTYRLTPG